MTTEGLGRGLVSSVGILTGGGGACEGWGCLGGPISWGLGVLGLGGTETGTGAGTGMRWGADICPDTGFTAATSGLGTGLGGGRAASLAASAAAAAAAISSAFFLAANL